MQSPLRFLFYGLDPLAFRCSAIYWCSRKRWTEGSFVNMCSYHFYAMDESFEVDDSSFVFFRNLLVEVSVVN